jgi:hypothetical protein
MISSGVALSSLLSANISRASCLSVRAERQPAHSGWAHRECNSIAAELEHRQLAEQLEALHHPTRLDPAG